MEDVGVGSTSRCLGAGCGGGCGLSLLVCRAVGAESGDVVRVVVFVPGPVESIRWVALTAQ